MNFTSLINKFTFSSSKKNQLRVVIQADTIYISASTNIEEDFLQVPIGSSWDLALEQALNSVGSFDGVATVVFCSQYYQSYQIDKPELPREEWSVALPFLLKDLISEKVTDIVADACLLPDERRIQAYVLSKAYLMSLVKVFNKANITLDRVLPEEEVWCQYTSDSENFMMLYRAMKGNYKIGAYVKKQNQFQREVRSVAPPLTGSESNQSQLDSIALELQRSMDYLSSKLRDVAVNDLYVCCDEDNADELVDALSKRLSIRVSKLNTGSHLLYGQLLCNTMLHLSGEGIDLYPEHVKPKRELLTLNSVAFASGLLILVMYGYYGFVHFEVSKLDKELQSHSLKKEQLTEEFSRLSTLMADHKPSPAKLAAIDRLKVDIKYKKAALEKVNQFDDSLEGGYSGVMASLANLGRNDISISHIELKGNTLGLKGLARTPSSVPKWIKQFKSELHLVGRAFDNLNIGRNEKDIVTFELTAFELTNKAELILDRGQ